MNSIVGQIEEKMFVPVVKLNHEENAIPLLQIVVCGGSWMVPDSLIRGGAFIKQIAREAVAGG